MTTPIWWSMFRQRKPCTLARLSQRTLAVPSPSASAGRCSAIAFWAALLCKSSSCAPSAPVARAPLLGASPAQAVQVQPVKPQAEPSPPSLYAYEARSVSTSAKAYPPSSASCSMQRRRHLLSVCLWKQSVHEGETTAQEASTDIACGLLGRTPTCSDRLFPDPASNRLGPAMQLHRG